MITMLALGAVIFAVGMVIGFVLRSEHVESRDDLSLSVRRLQLSQGDRVLLTTDKELTREQVANIERWWKEFAGDGVRCAVLSGGLKAQIIASEK